MYVLGCTISGLIFGTPRLTGGRPPSAKVLAHERGRGGGKRVSDDGISMSLSLSHLHFLFYPSFRDDGRKKGNLQ